MPAPRNLIRTIPLHDLLAGRSRMWRLLGELVVAGLLALGILLAIVQQAAADSDQDKEEQSWRKDWDVSLGAGAIYKPKYQGADSYELNPLPSFDITWRDRVFVSARRGIGGTILSQEEGKGAGGGPVDGYSVGVALRPSESRDEDDDDRLDGLGDVDLSAEAGLFATLESGMFEFGAEIYQDVGDGHEGLHGSLSVEYKRPISERFMLGAEATIDFADEDYMESFFGVSSSQSGRSGLTTYDAGSRIYNLGVEISARYQISGGWSLYSFAGYGLLVGDAADSPIVEDEGAAEAGAFIVYTF